VIQFRAGQWIGLSEVTKEELAALRQPAERSVLKAALYFEGAVKKKLTGPRTGRIYRIGKRGRTYQASAPGEPPAVKTGKLRQSIAHVGPTWDGDSVSAEVGSRLVYAARLEFGGTDSRGVRILPRPYLSATFLEEEANLTRILEEAGR